MARLKEIKKNTLGGIAALRTVLERYPVLIEADQDKNETSFTFMLNILKIIGVSEQEILEWVANLFSGSHYKVKTDEEGTQYASEGVLGEIEASVKAILLANIKGLFSCEVNPLLPDRLMDGVEQRHIGDENADELQGIEIDLTDVDPYGMLETCPIGDGSVFYFDTKDSDYNIDDMNNPDRIPSLYHEGYTTNELWKSRDFNAYLWYVINKGNNFGTAKNKTYWDNRVDYLLKFSRDKQVKEAFFNAQEEYTSSDTTMIVVRDPDVVKKRYVRCEYIEKSSMSSRANTLRIYLNPNLYYRKRKITVKVGGIQRAFSLNKTVFEFSYDYIYSLKLFNARVLVSSIVNSLLGITGNITATISVNRQLFANRIRKVVNKIMAADDNGGSIDDCYFTFSNKEYDEMLADAINKYNGKFQVGSKNVDVDYADIIKQLNKINDFAKMVPGSKQEKDAIKDTFVSIGNILSRTVTSTDFEEEGGNIGVDFGFTVVNTLISEIVTQIVMQVLSPKIAILLKVQTAIMGEEKNNDTWEYFMSNFNNLLTQMVINIKDMILQRLMRWVMDELSVLLELFVSKLLLEKMMYYRRLLISLTNNMMSIRSLFRNRYYNNVWDGIENSVDYADIENFVPEKTEPDKTICY